MLSDQEIAEFKAIVEGLKDNPYRMWDIKQLMENILTLTEALQQTRQDLRDLWDIACDPKLDDEQTEVALDGKLWELCRKYGWTEGGEDE